MSPTTKMDSVTTPLMSKARQPVSQPTPQKPVASPDPSNHSVLRIEPSEASRTSHMPFAVALEGLHPNPATEVDAMVPLHLRGDLADDAAERANERCRGALRDGHRKA